MELQQAKRFFETIARIISDREGVEVEVKVTPAVPENKEVKENELKVS